MRFVSFLREACSSYLIFFLLFSLPVLAKTNVRMDSWGERGWEEHDRLSYHYQRSISDSAPSSQENEKASREGIASSGKPLSTHIWFGSVESVDLDEDDKLPTEDLEDLETPLFGFEGFSEIFPPPPPLPEVLLEKNEPTS